VHLSARRDRAPDMIGRHDRRSLIHVRGIEPSEWPSPIGNRGQAAFTDRIAVTKTAVLPPTACATKPLCSPCKLLDL
jgi:hypothetical protein